MGSHRGENNLLPTKPILHLMFYTFSELEEPCFDIESKFKDAFLHFQNPYIFFQGKYFGRLEFE